MSNRQGSSKDQDDLDKEREIARRLASEKRQREESEKKILLETREKAKEKLNQVVKSKGGSKSNKILGMNQYQLALFVVGVITAVLVVLPFVGSDEDTSDRVIDAGRIEAFNKENKGFKVGPNEFFDGWSWSDAQSHVSGITNSGSLSTCGEIQIENLPKKFNSRLKHTHCLSPVYDQGKCSSSYAFAIAGMMSNRYCIIHDGNKKFDATAQYLVACESKKGCVGGDLNAAANIALKKGLVNNICLPYNTERSDSCDTERLQNCFKLQFKQLCTTNDPEQIKRHIYKNGPVASLIKASKEFLVYSGGVYDAKKGKIGHYSSYSFEWSPGSQDYWMGY